MKPIFALQLTVSTLVTTVLLHAQVHPVAGGRAIRHRGTCHHLRAVADPRRQRDIATAVFAWAKFYREECGTDLLRIEPLHD